MKTLDELIVSDEMRDLVKKMASVGVPQHEIAKVIYNPNTNKPITHVTLIKYFRNELDAGVAHANYDVANALYQSATGTGGERPNVLAQIFWCKTRMGWRETSDIRITTVQENWLDAIASNAIDVQALTDETEDDDEDE